MFVLKKLFIIFYLLGLITVSASSQTVAHSPTFHSDEIFIAPSYFHFSDKDDAFGAYGGTLEYTHRTSETLGLTLDLGYYTNTKNETDLKSTNNLLTITAGVTYIPRIFGNDSKLELLTHGLIGMVNYKAKLEQSIGTSKISKGGFCFNLGAALNYQISRKMDWRILQADYIPTFFFNSTQSNYRLSTGLTFKWGN